MTQRLVRMMVAALVLGGAVWGVPPVARADSAADREPSADQQITSLQDELEGGTSALIGAVAQLRATQLGMSQAKAQVVLTQASLAAAVAADESRGSRLAFAQAQADKAQQDVLADEVSAQTGRLALGQLAREVYVGDRMSGLSVALGATSPDEFGEQLAVAGAALRAQGGALDRLSVVQSDLRAHTARLEAVRAEVAQLEQDSSIMVYRRLAAVRVAEAAQAQVTTLSTSAAHQLAVIRSSVVAEERRLARVDVDRTSLEAVLASRITPAAVSAARRQAAGAWTPPAAAGFLSSPADGPITSGYGMRYHPVLDLYRMHTGIDIGTVCGAQVRAAADGEIVSSGAGDANGAQVVIDHGEVAGGDLATTYDGLGTILVTSGWVHRGQLIATSGRTGPSAGSTGCHLHFETLLNARYVDPMTYL